MSRDDWNIRLGSPFTPGATSLEGSQMLPIAPPLLPEDHHNRHLSCIAALSANFDADALGRINAAVFEGWSRSEATHAVEALRKSKVRDNS